MTGAGSRVNQGVTKAIRLGSSFRCERAERTLDIALSLMQPLGISRLTDITRMDRLDLPVFASVRPRGQVLRVHAGKGVLALDAKVGAVMEAIEYAAAEPERSRWDAKTMTFKDAASRLAAYFQMVDLVPRLRLGPPADKPIQTVACELLGCGEIVFIPAELVFLPWSADSASQIFGWTSNGLASGNSLDEATLHALLEVLERDAIALNMPRDESLWIEHDEFPDTFRQLALTWKTIGVELAVRHVPNLFQLPCFQACVHEVASESVNLAAGFGMHFDRDIALSRAVCEAAQSRLSHVHGGREDVTHFYSKRHTVSAEREAALIAKIFDKHASASYLSLPSEPLFARSISELLNTLLHKLSALGFGHVLRHRFAVDLNGLHVVKIIIPKCEHLDHGSTRIGRRLYQRIIENA